MTCKGTGEEELESGVSQNRPSIGLKSPGNCWRWGRKEMTHGWQSPSYMLKMLNGNPGEKSHFTTGQKGHTELVSGCIPLEDRSCLFLIIVSQGLQLYLAHNSYTMTIPVFFP